MLISKGPRIDPFVVYSKYNFFPRDICRIYFGSLLFVFEITVHKSKPSPFDACDSMCICQYMCH